MQLGQGTLIKRPGEPAESPVFQQAPKRTSSLPDWTLKMTAPTTLASVPAQFKAIGRSNLALAILVLFQVAPEQVGYFLQ